MESTVYKKQSLLPFLIICGALLTIAGGILIHYSIWLVTPYSYFSSAEALTQIICGYVGIAAIIIPIALIGSVYPQKKKDTNTAIILLVVFIGFDLFISLTPDISNWGSGWGGLAVLVVFGIIRGVTFLRTNRALKVPKKGYGNPMLLVYGWTFLITTILALLFAVIAAIIDDYDVFYMLLEAAAWVIVVQSFIDALSITLVGLKFLRDGLTNPTIESEQISRTAPTSGIGRSTYQPIQISGQATDQVGVTQDEELLKYCTYCGAQNFKGHTFCENCGKKID